MRRPLLAGLCHGNQMSSQIAAVNCRDISRFKNVQVRRVVPVVKMAVKALQPRQCGKGLFQPGNRLCLTNPAHVLRHSHRQKIKTDICGRGARGYHGAGDFLKIVGGQEMAVFGHECLEIAPGAAGNQTQGVALGDTKGDCGMIGNRQADPACDSRGCQPQDRKTQNQRPDRGIQRISQGAGEQPKRHPARLLQIEPGISGHCRPTRLRRCQPFQQMLSIAKANRCARDGIQHLRCRVGKQNHHQGDLRKSQPQVA